MPDKKFKGAPFGKQSTRFDMSAVHPKNRGPNPNDTLSQKLGPGSYYADADGFSEKAIARRAAGPGWARAYEVSRMAALPHLLYRDQWEQKRLMLKRLGPGSYNIGDFLTSENQKPRTSRGVCQTLEPRFKDTSTAAGTPGPGTYGIEGIPHKALEDKQKQSASTVGLLDNGPSSNKALPIVGSGLGPGCYNFSSCMSDLTKKSVGTRGPYDLFTAERNKPILTGHYAAPIGQNLGPGQYNLHSFLEELDSAHKRKHGKFGKVAQYPAKDGGRLFSCILSLVPRDPDDPSPAHYDPKSPGDHHYESKKHPGFLSSSQRNDRMAQKFFTRNFNPVGAGRYDIQKFDESRHINGHTSAFRSKTARPNHAREKFLKERIRAKDLRYEDKVVAVEPEETNDHAHQARADATKYLAQRAATVH